MKNILILVAVTLSLLGCSKPIPKYPDQLKTFHLVEIVGQPIEQKFLDAIENVDDFEERMSIRSNASMNCLEFNVEKINPYQVKFVGVVEDKNCHAVSGYKPDETVILFNWVDDVLKFADEHKCFDKNKSP